MKQIKRTFLEGESPTLIIRLSHFHVGTYVNINLLGRQRFVSSGSFSFLFFLFFWEINWIELVRGNFWVFSLFLVEGCKYNWAKFSFWLPYPNILTDQFWNLIIWALLTKELHCLLVAVNLLKFFRNSSSRAIVKGRLWKIQAFSGSGVKCKFN